MIKHFITYTFIILFLSSCNFIKNQEDAIKFFPVNSGGKYGFIDKEGKFTINPQFSEVSV